VKEGPVERAGRPGQEAAAPVSGRQVRAATSRTKCPPTLQTKATLIETLAHRKDLVLTKMCWASGLILATKR
jgi:hypothetical protein